jgi:hypothetical protein
MKLIGSALILAFVLMSQGAAQTAESGSMAYMMSRQAYLNYRVGPWMNDAERLRIRELDARIQN